MKRVFKCSFTDVGLSDTDKDFNTISGRALPYTVTGQSGYTIEYETDSGENNQWTASTVFEEFCCKTRLERLYYIL